MDIYKILDQLVLSFSNIESCHQFLVYILHKEFDNLIEVSDMSDEMLDSENVVVE